MTSLCANNYGIVGVIYRCLSHVYLTNKFGNRRRCRLILVWCRLVLKVPVTAKSVFRYKISSKLVFLFIPTACLIFVYTTHILNPNRRNNTK